ncbi:MAG: RHS repeat-associated core domain-containing protein, partial [Ruminococcus sp.]|nr:RHS repeat-associated core domain-containing protein [Ruminococcus sp.]
NSRVYTVEQSYDKNNNVSKLVQSAGTISPTQLYSYGKDNLPDVYTMYSGRKQTYTFDILNRYNHMELSLDKPVMVDYSYHMSERNAEGETKYRTTKPVCEFLNNTIYRYSYDKLGNITAIDQGERVDDTVHGKNYVNKITYAYDALSQLTRENNKYLNQTITYTYDNGGNITQKTIYPYTTESLSSVTPTQTIVYTYGNSSWKDLLTSYNGQNITYDAIGNPTSYLGYTLAWNGRQLSSLSGNGVTASYKYDADGLRSYKKVGNVETTYQYVGDKLMYEKRGTTEFYYYYNSLGQLAGIKYIQNGTEYMVYAICNMRGDVEDLYWGNGNLVCHYTYDSWGNIISVTDINGNEITDTNHIGLMNPFRYRGYYYDSEIGMYYLQSRYYNPQVGRFLNADGYISTGQGVLDYNMFAYCGNSPVNRTDSTGHSWVAALLVASIVGVCAVGLSGCSAKQSKPSNYVENKSTKQNCYSYAFNLPQAANPGDYSVSKSNPDYMYKSKNAYTPQEITGYIERDMKALNKSVRVVNSPSDKADNEYIVAMKTSDIIIPFINVADYHFAVQLSDGTWADKPGQKPSRWNALDGTAIAWDCGDIKNYYNTESVYFAVVK